MLGSDIVGDVVVGSFPGFWIKDLNKPLQKYGTRMLIDIYLDSGIKRISTENLYIEG